MFENLLISMVIGAISTQGNIPEPTDAQIPLLAYTIESQAVSQSAESEKTLENALFFSSINFENEEEKTVLKTEKEQLPVVHYFDQTTITDNMPSVWDFSKVYQSRTFASSGCGPAAMAIVVSTLTEKEITPQEVLKSVNIANKRNYYVFGQGSAHDLIPDAGSFYGLSVDGSGSLRGEALHTWVEEHLKQNHFMVQICSYGIFTRNGHFITYIGLDDQGYTTVYDPNGKNYDKSGRSPAYECHDGVWKMPYKVVVGENSGVSAGSVKGPVWAFWMEET